MFKNTVIDFTSKQVQDVALITPSIHYTMGGLKMNSVGEILRSFKTNDNTVSEKPIIGLYGAGEVTGGVHGKNRLAGNSLLECVVFGRLAGRRAAQINYSGPGNQSYKL